MSKAKKVKSGQGEIIDEIRKHRSDLWSEYKGDMKSFLKTSKKIAEKYGMKYSSPKKDKKQEDAA